MFKTRVIKAKPFILASPKGAEFKWADMKIFFLRGGTGYKVKNKTLSPTIA